MQRMALILAIWIAGLSGALAQQAHPNSPIALSTPKVGVASVVVAPPNAHRAGLYVFNPSNTVPLWVAPAGTQAAVSGAGSIVIQPGQGMMFGPPSMPPWTNGMSAIASGDGGPISVLEY
jgi:hypothetical protein